MHGMIPMVFTCHVLSYSFSNPAAIYPTLQSRGLGSETEQLVLTGTEKSGFEWNPDPGLLLQPPKTPYMKTSFVQGTIWCIEKALAIKDSLKSFCFFKFEKEI